MQHTSNLLSLAKTMGLEHCSGVCNVHSDFFFSLLGALFWKLLFVAEHEMKVMFSQVSVILFGGGGGEERGHSLSLSFKKCVRIVGKQYKAVVSAYQQINYENNVMYVVQMLSRDVVK